MRRKFLSVLLAMAMVLTTVPVTALALDAPAAPAALGEDDVTVAATSITINASVAANEYAVVDNTGDNATAPTDDAEWKKGNDDALEISGLTAKTKYNVYQRIAAVEEDNTADPAVEAVPASDASDPLAVVTLPGTPAAVATNKLTVEADSITVTDPVAENEYACVAKATGGETAAPTSGWVAGSSSEVKFADLEAGTAYVVFVRVAADAANGIPASEAASTEVTTKAAPISKVTITLAKPETGAAKGPDAATEATTYEVTTTTWADGKGTALTGKVKGNTAYTATVTLTAKGTTFAADATVDDVTGATSTSGEVAEGGATMTVTVVFPATAAATVSTLTITTQPTKVTYNVGESFDSAGMVVKATYNDDTTNDAYTNYTCEVADPLTADTTKVVVKDKTNANAKAEQAISVTKKQVALTIATPTASEITYGDPLSASTITPGAVTNAEGQTVTGGSWAWKDSTAKPDAGDAVTVVAVYTPPTSNTVDYTDAESANFERNVTVKVAKAQASAINVTVEGGSVKAAATLPTSATGKGAKNEDATGTLAWYTDSARTDEISGGTGAFTDMTDGQKKTLYWKFTATDTANYEGTKTGSVEFTVTDKKILVFTFANAEKTETYTANGTVTNALGMTEDGAPKTITDIASLSVAYSSSDTDVATVVADGTVTLGTKAGTATITATISGVPDTHVCDKTAVTYTLTVNKADAAKPAKVDSAKVSTTSNSITIADSETGNLYAVVAGVAPTESSAWKAGTGDALVFSGLTAETAYNVYVKTAATDTHNESVASDALAVTTDAAPSVTSVTVSPSTLSLTVGGNSALSVTVVPEGTAVTWSSSDSTVATVDQSGKVTAVAAGSATITATAGDKSGSCTVTVTSGGGGSHSSGGSGGGGGSTSSTVTVPVSGDDNSVEVSAKVSGSTATIDKIDGLDKVLDSDADTGVVEIDLTALKKDIDTVSISASSIEDIAKAAADSDNDVDGLAIKLDSGTVEFDADALEAIVDQATSSSIQLVLEKTNSSDLNSSQRDAVKDMDIHGHFDLTLTGGKAITDFKGGKVSVKIPFSVPSGKDAANFVVIYVANDGTVEEMRTSCSGGYISFTTDHFSKYLIAYKDSEPVEPVETPETADCNGGANCPAGKFTDVNTDLWYHKAIDYVLTNGLMSGVGDGTFAPNANLSRAMLAQILYNQEGRPAASADSVFDDVAAGMWYTNAIAWAAENGVVSGLGDGKFGPNNNITREQLAVMLYRYAGSPAAAGSLSGFADADKASGYAQNALVWATSNGVMSGKGGGMLDPQGQATRAEVAQMLYNYLNK